MQGNVATQVEKEELIIRHAPRPRPRSPQRGPWQGTLPYGVERIVERQALDQDFCKLYAKWASSFALLTDTFIGETVKGASLGASSIYRMDLFQMVRLLFLQGRR